jgi:hypothetical protein
MEKPSNRPKAESLLLVLTIGHSRPTIAELSGLWRPVNGVSFIPLVSFRHFAGAVINIGSQRVIIKESDAKSRCQSTVDRAGRLDQKSIRGIAIDFNPDSTYDSWQ